MDDFPRDKTLEERVLGILQQNRVERQASHERDGLLYASEIGSIVGESACWRKLWYALHGAPSEIDPNTLLAFEAGDVIGLRIANILSEAGLVDKVEVSLDFNPWPIKGRLDVLLMGDTLVELKTTTINQRKYLPREEHINQLTIYLHGLRKIRPNANGALFYVFKDPHKGDPALHIYSVPYDDARWLRLLSAIIKARHVASGPELPPRPEKFTRTKYPCAYCLYQKTCWQVLDEEVVQGVG